MQCNQLGLTMGYNKVIRNRANGASVGECVEYYQHFQCLENTIGSLKPFHLRLFPWFRIGELKQQLADLYKGKVFIKDIRLFFKNIELLNERKAFIDFYRIPNDAHIIIKAKDNDKDIYNGIIIPYKLFEKVPQKISDLLLQVQSGLSCGRKPRLAAQGTSGTYFLENHHRKEVAVYKPYDEEPYTPNNPRNLVGKLGQQGIRRGILSGECATREVAAYLLDGQSFHGVPATTYVEFYHPSFSYREHSSTIPIPSTKECSLNLNKTKHGSLQQFIESPDVVGNYGSRVFDVEEVHKVAILDLRILNCDRNEANILVKKIIRQTKITRLIPIDHGLSMPDNFQIYDYLIVWMGYEQVRRPLSQRSLDFIAKIDPVEDSNMLGEKLGFRNICLRNFRIAEMFLKKMALAGFTLFQIGSFVYRKDEDQFEEGNQEKISELQKLVKQAENIFFTVKVSGIKSTVEFQIGLIKSRKQQQSSQWNKNIKDTIVQEEVPLTKKPSKKTSIEKKTNFKKEKSRNISLPHLIDQNTIVKKKKKKFYKRVRQEEVYQQEQNVQNWGEIFFHYFEDFLQRFVDEKRKAKNKPLGRGRLMSEVIEKI